MKAGVKAARFPARAAGLAAAVAAALLLSGCAAGQHAQTTNAYETLDGVGGRVGDTITLGGAAIERPTDDISWAKDSNVPLKIVIVNSGRSDDQLTTITSPSFTGWGVYPSAAAAAANAPTSGASASGSSDQSPVTVPALSRLQYGTQDESGAPPNQVLLLTGLKSTLYPGSVIDLTMTFAKAGTTTLHVPVELTKSAHSSVIPGPSATGQEG